MKKMNGVRWALVPILLSTLFGCDEGTSFGDNTFRTQYVSAREALEDGRYDRANRGYKKLLDQAGPLEPRIRLEYAHSLLRAGNHAAAAQQAGQLARSQTDTPRRAALAVRGTAEHELALDALRIGDRAKGKAFLRQAEEAIAEVLKNDPDLDPLGSLAGRQASIKVRLNAL